MAPPDARAAPSEPRLAPARLYRVEGEIFPRLQEFEHIPPWFFSRRTFPLPFYLFRFLLSSEGDPMNLKSGVYLKHVCYTELKTIDR